MSLINKTLTIDDQETEAFEISRSCCVLISGNTPCVLLRSVSNSDFYPLTDSEGNEIVYEATNFTDVIFNGNVENNSRFCKFKIAIVSGAASETSNVNVILGQGW